LLGKHHLCLYKIGSKADMTKQIRQTPPARHDSL